MLAAELTATDAWSEFLRLALHHRVAPLALHLMAGLALGVPPPVHVELQKWATANAFHALQAATELARLRAALGDDNFTILKGIALSQQLYGTPNARHVGDLDVLTAVGDLPRQLAALAACEYRLLHPAARLTPQRIRAYQRFWKDATLLNEASGFELDLHWRLFNHALHPANRLLEEAARAQVKVFNTTLPVLSLQTQFLYACAHGVSDAFTFAKSLADVAAFLRLFTRAELDDALARAQSLGLLPQVSAAIHLVDAWLGTATGTATGSATGSAGLLLASDPLARALLETASANLLSQRFSPQREARSPLAWLRWEQRLVGGPRATLERVRRFVWRPRVWSVVDLPDGLFWCYGVLGLLLRPRKGAGR